MHNIVISDTSCLIVLHKIGELDLLKKVYNSVLTTPEVAEEFLEELPGWIKIESAKDKKYQNFLETQIDRGEASAIALATESENSLLLKIAHLNSLLKMIRFLINDIRFIKSLILNRTSLISNRKSN